MSRYLGTGAGGWITEGLPPFAYRYAPSQGDRSTASAWASVIEERHRRSRARSGYGAPASGSIRWRVRGILGEIAALYPIGTGPDLASRAWRGSADFGSLEVRTTSRRQLYGFARRPDRYPAGLAGWLVTAKDAGRTIVCVLDRDTDLLVLGWLPADDARRLPRPIGGIVAIVELDELLPLADLYGEQP